MHLLVAARDTTVFNIYVCGGRHENQDKCMSGNLRGILKMTVYIKKTETDVLVESDIR